jgi:hypothetical protein
MVFNINEFSLKVIIMTNRYNQKTIFVWQHKTKSQQNENHFCLPFISLSLILNAQTKHEISAGVGPSFFGWGDVLGAAFTATCNYQFFSTGNGDKRQ